MNQSNNSLQQNKFFKLSNTTARTIKYKYLNNTIFLLISFTFTDFSCHDHEVHQSLHYFQLNQLFLQLSHP